MLKTQICRNVYTNPNHLWPTRATNTIKPTRTIRPTRAKSIFKCLLKFRWCPPQIDIWWKKGWTFCLADIVLKLDKVKVKREFCSDLCHVVFNFSNVPRLGLFECHSVPFYESVKSWYLPLLSWRAKSLGGFFGNAGFVKFIKCCQFCNMFISFRSCSVEKNIAFLQRAWSRRIDKDEKGEEGVRSADQLALQLQREASLPTHWSPKDFTFLSFTVNNFNIMDVLEAEPACEVWNSLLIMVSQYPQNYFGSLTIRNISKLFSLQR